MNKTLLSTLIITALGTNFTHAETLDAGSISRQAEQNQPIQPQTVEMPSLAEAVVSTDNTPITVKQVVLSGRTLLSAEQVQPLLDGYTDTTTTFGGLQTLASQVTSIYHQAGYPLATVIVPPQRIENGVVVLQAIEGVVAKIDTLNQSRLSDKTVQGYLTRAIPTAQPLRQTDSERALLLIKDLAGTEGVNYRLAEGEQGTNLVVDLDKASPINSFVQVDNYGGKNTGEWRTRAGLSLNSAFGRGERLSLQGMSSFKGVDYARISADLPVGYRGLTLSAGAGHTRYELGGAFRDLDATGTANTIDVTLRYPVLRSNAQNVWLSLGGEQRKLQDKVNATNTVTDKSLQALYLTLNGHSQSRTLSGAYTQWSLTNTIGQLDIDTPDARNIDAASAKTAGNYHKIAASLSRTQYLSPKFSIQAGVSGQWANKNLDSAEQMSLGGADGIAAYHSNDVSGDIGIIGQLEARYALHPAVSIGAFYDAGITRLRAKPYTTADNIVELHGGGIGLYAQHKGLSLQSKVAWQGSDDTFGDKKEPRWWLNAGWSF